MPTRVLLADDHALVREGLSMILAAEGIDVVGEAASGLEAVDACLELGPDVVVMDIAMPDLDGIDATARLHELAPETRVIVLSMYSTAEHVYQALRAGAAGFLVKDSAGREVAAAVRTVAAGGRYLARQLADTMVDDYVRLRERGSTRSPLESLSRREREVLQLVAAGHSSAEVARALNLSPKTVETYRSRLMGKLGVHDLPALVRLAVQHGLVPP